MKAKLLSSVSVGWGLLSILAILSIPSLAAAQLGDLPVVEPAQATPVEAAVPVPAASTLYRVHLAVDGNVPGSVKVLAKLDIAMPVRATISVFRDGLLVSTTHSNEQGRFQLPGLLPGVYSVIADAGNHMGVFAVEVLPYKREAVAGAPVALTAATSDGAEDDGEATLDLLLSTEADDTPTEAVPMEPLYAPMMSGGGGGGGGGGGMLLGLAGLAGLAGLGGLGGGGAASPATP
jgi:hypothetical protein